MKKSITRKCLNCLLVLRIQTLITCLSKGPQITTAGRIPQMKRQFSSTHFHAQNVIYSISRNAHTYLLRCLLWYFPALSSFFTNTVKFTFTILILFMLGVDLKNLGFLRTLHVFTTYYICSRLPTDNNCSQVLSKSSKQPEKALSQVMARVESLLPLLSLEIKH